jgi:two-component system response regulator YesN
MLRTTDQKSSQIARDVGYNDSHYFSYIFKKNTGITPSEYRAQNQNEPE